MITNDIPIKYVNSSKRSDVQVVVFAKNTSSIYPTTVYTAWHILRGQSSVQFIYPASIGVGVSYKTSGMTVTAGPIDADHGSTWEIVQESMNDSATLKRKTGVAPNPNGSIVIKNVPPATWSGRKFDVAIYKERHVLLQEKGLCVGMQVDFVIEPKLYFGVVSHMKVGQSFESLTSITTLTDFDLSQFPNGIEVTLNVKPGGGQLYFTADQYM